MNIKRTTQLLWAGLLLSVSLAAGTAYAGAPLLDNGKQVSADSPYTDAQTINNVFENKGVYGKLTGDIPVDVFTFTADKDGEQTFRLLVKGQERNASSQPFLILVDPTNATEASDIGLAVPANNYHTAIVTPVDPGKNYTEHWLLDKYSIAAEQKIQLQKNAKYYLVVFDIGHQVTHYAIGIGNGSLWSGKDFFTHFGNWFRIKTDNYAGESPFSFSTTVLGMLIFLLGVITLVGTWLVHELYSLLARIRTSEMSIRRFQEFLPYGRILFWISLWFTAIGGYILFAKKGFDGIPFVLTLLFIPIVVSVLYSTIRLYHQVLAIKGGNRDAITVSLRRWLLAFCIVSGLSLAAFVTFLSIYLA